MKGLLLKLAIIKKIQNFDYLLQAKQKQSEIIKYYRTNRLAYWLFHNKQGYRHMGISLQSTYHEADVLEQLKYLEKAIQDHRVMNVLELGYGRGANIDYLARKFPQKRFVGVDISTAPRKKYQAHKNTTFIKENFHDLNKLQTTFNLVYAVETLCHSDNLGRLFQSIAGAMEAGARLIVFDGYYLKNKQSLPAAVRQACSLTEKGMAVDEFHFLERFKQEALRFGLVLDEEQDLSQQILPSLYRFERLASCFVKYRWLAKWLNFLLPGVFVRNFLSGYLMPDLINLRIAGYYRQVFIKQ